MNRLQFCAYLRTTLIPDLRAAEMDAMADDFETALQFITEDALVISDCADALVDKAIEIKAKLKQ